MIIRFFFFFLLGISSQSFAAENSNQKLREILNELEIKITASEEELRSALQRIIELIENTQDPADPGTSSDIARITALHCAVSLGDPAIMSQLIALGAKSIDALAQDSLTPLHFATLYGRTEIIRILLQHGANIEARDNNQVTPLHLAGINRQTEAIRILLQHGANIEARDNTHLTLLHLAAATRQTEVIRILLQYGADVEARDNNQLTPLHLAAGNGQTEAIRILLQYGADIEARDNNQLTPLHLAAINGQIEVIPILLQHGAYIEAQEQNEQTPLRYSVRSNNSFILLLAYGADFRSQYDAILEAMPDDVDYPLETLLHACYASKSRDEFLTLLLDYAVKQNNAALLTRLILEANLLAGENILHRAVLLGHRDALQLLLQDSEHTSSLVNGLNSVQRTPLSLAVQMRNPEAERLLIDAGANPLDGRALTPAERIPPFNGESTVPLVHSEEVEHQPFVVENNTQKLGVILNELQSKKALSQQELRSALQRILELIQNSQDPADPETSSNGLRFTALHWAAILGDPAIISQLINLGARINTPAQNKLTPLHLAAQQGHIQAISMLLRNGANIEAVDQNNRTPLIRAAGIGNPFVLLLLVAHGAEFRSHYDSLMGIVSHLPNSRALTYLLSDLNKYTDRDQFLSLLLNCADTQNYASLLLENYTGRQNDPVLLTRLILEANLLFGENILHRAVLLGDHMPVQLLLYGSHPSIPPSSLVNGLNSLGLSPLYLAVLLKNQKMVRLLLQAGADPLVNGRTLTLAERIPNFNVRSIIHISAHPEEAEEQPRQRRRVEEPSLYDRIFTASINSVFDRAVGILMIPDEDRNIPFIPSEITGIIGAFLIQIASHSF